MNAFFQIKRKNRSMLLFLVTQYVKFAEKDVELPFLRLKKLKIGNFLPENKFTTLPMIFLAPIIFSISCLLFFAELSAKSTESPNVNEKLLLSESEITKRLSIDPKTIDRAAPLPASLAEVCELATAAVASIKVDDSYANVDDFRDILENMFNNYPLSDEQKQQLIDDFFQNKQSGIGSAVLISNDGYAITNAHIAVFAQKIKARLPTFEQDFDAALVGYDKTSDIAVIKINNKNLELPKIRIAQAKPKQGDFCVAVGSPFDLPSSVSFGIISAVKRRGFGFKSNTQANNILNEGEFIQTDAAINIGNSGGALLDIEGRLIGISSIILTPSGGNSGVGFAVPVQKAVEIAKEIITHGYVRRGFIGVEGSELNLSASLQSSKSKSGALVVKVIPDTPAELADLQARDIIQKVNDKAISSFSELRRVITAMKPGEEVKLGILRAGKKIKSTLELGDLEKHSQKLRIASITAREIKPMPKISEEVEEEKIVINFFKHLELSELEELNEDEFEKLNLPAKVKSGLLVKEIDIEGNELRKNDIIVSVGSEDVSNVEEAEKLARETISNKVFILGIYRKKKAYWQKLLVAIEEKDN